MFLAASQVATFSTHRMALAGKELGKDVGQWFEPSMAAGAIKYVLPSYCHLFVE
jgi:cysteine protease ATG4